MAGDAKHNKRAQARPRAALAIAESIDRSIDIRENRQRARAREREGARTRAKKAANTFVAMYLRLVFVWSDVGSLKRMCCLARLVAAEKCLFFMRDDPRRVVYSSQRNGTSVSHIRTRRRDERAFKADRLGGSVSLTPSAHSARVFYLIF